MGSDINEVKAMLNAIKQTVKTTEGDTANIAILEEKINELKVAQDERDVKNTNECISILEGVSEIKSLSTAIKQATSYTANKEDIKMLKQEIDEMKKAQKNRDEEDNQAYSKILEGVSSDIKEDVAMLEQKITEPEVALDERDAQPTNADCNMAEVIAAISGAVMLVNHAGEAWGAVNDFLHSGNGRHNLFVGKAEPGDILLHEEQKRPGCKMFGHVSHVYQYNGDKLITTVVARDNWDDDTGGDPEIISGGPGHKHVKVKVTSQFSRGFNHTVYVYGKK